MAFPGRRPCSHTRRLPSVPRGSSCPQRLHSEPESEWFSVYSQGRTTTTALRLRGSAVPDTSRGRNQAPRGLPCGSASRIARHCFPGLNASRARTGHTHTSCISLPRAPGGSFVPHRGGHCTPFGPWDTLRSSSVPSLHLKTKNPICTNAENG